MSRASQMDSEQLLSSSKMDQDSSVHCEYARELMSRSTQMYRVLFGFVD